MPKRWTRKDDPPVMKRNIFGKATSRSRDLHKEIPRRAHELLLERGGSDGHADQDWVQAKREVCREK